MSVMLFDRKAVTWCAELMASTLPPTCSIRKSDVWEKIYSVEITVHQEFN